MITHKDFAIFILSYKRANKIYTLNTLKESNYTGDWYILIGDDDPEIDEYKRLYKDKLFIFNKDEASKLFDMCDNFDGKNVVVYARNYCFELAKQLGLKCFAMFDDDYTSFEYRYDNGEKLKIMKSKEFDEVCNIFCDFLYDTDVKTICFAQGGDFIGGKESQLFRNKIKRKAMNSFFCRTDKPFSFMGRINEDVNAYVLQGKTGDLFLTVCDMALVQKTTQKNKGGLSDIYNAEGTYLKSFYSVIVAPSCVKIQAMETTYTRVHHKINWNYAVPKIVSSSFKK